MRKSEKVIPIVKWLVSSSLNSSIHLVSGPSIRRPSLTLPEILIMKITILFLAIAMIIGSCDKPEPPVPPKETHPQMSFIDLAGKTVSFSDMH
jgi:hypothetical protein